MNNRIKRLRRKMGNRREHSIRIKEQSSMWRWRRRNMLERGLRKRRVLKRR
jgi:hypothetical protein